MLGIFLKYLNYDKTEMRVIKSFVMASFFTVIVRVFGIIKESTIAYYFGVSKFVDFYVLALVFTTFFLIPISNSIGVMLTQSYIKLQNKVSQERSANIFIKCQILIIICSFFIILVQVGILQIPMVQGWISFNFIDLKGQYILILLPICLLSLMSLVNKSVLSAREQFNTYNILPIFIPLSIVIALTIFPENSIFEALLLGTIVGFTLEFAIGALCLRKVILKINYKTFNKTTMEFKKIIRAMPTMFLSGMIMSGCLVVDQLMAIFAGEGSISMINYGSRVSLGLISIVGITWTILHTNFVKYAATNNYISFKKTFLNFSLLSILILAPVCLSLSFFSKDLVIILFERGKFTNTDTETVSIIQKLYIFHIPLYVICMICIRVINTLENTNIILLGNVLLLILNIILNLFFIKKYGVIGVPLATIISYGLISIYWFLNANLLIKNQINQEI